MTKLQKLAKAAVLQGNDHQGRMTEFYATLNRAARLEFYEDNCYTLEHFLRECFEKSLKEFIIEGHRVKLTPEARESHRCPKERQNNRTATVHHVMVDGGLKMDRDLAGCQHWNREDVERA